VKNARCAVPARSQCGDFKKENLRMERGLRHNWGQGTYRYPLRYSLERAINQWENDRKESWAKLGIPGDIKNIIGSLEEAFGGRLLEKEEIFKIVEKFAEAVMATSKTLAPIEFERDLINYFYEETDLFRYAEERLEAHLAEDAIGKIEEAARRLTSLDYELYIIGNLHSTPAVTDFLQLVMRSYLWGFDTECIILCRSAMENAIKNRVGSGYRLVDLIDVAKREGILNDETAKIATSIRLRGNNALHKDPNSTKDIRRTIKETVKIISVVADGHDPFAPPSWLPNERI
jgi:hypothetical protein